MSALREKDEAKERAAEASDPEHPLTIVNGFLSTNLFKVSGCAPAMSSRFHP